MIKRYYFVIGFSLIALIIIVALILPQTAKIFGYFQEIDSKQKQIQELEQLISKTSELKEYEQRAKNVFSAIPATRDDPALMVEFSNLTQKSGLALEDISFSEAKGPTGMPTGVGLSFGEIPGDVSLSQLDKFNSLLVNLAVYGSYSDFKNFLKSLEKRAMDVTSINFNAPSNFGDLISFKIVVKVYYQ